MKRIRTKLRGQEGASFILALLFFLLCMMVGVSVLAAASSNAGKVESRRIEQQRYFAVSSALQLVAERLKNAKYTARATVAEVAVAPAEVPEPTEPDPGSFANPAEYDAAYQRYINQDLPKYNQYLADLADPTKNYSYTIYKQEPGELTYTGTSLESVLPLEGELEWLFSQTFPASDSNADFGESCDWSIPKTGLPEPSDTGHVMTLKLDDLTDPTLDKEVEGLKKNVYVTVRLVKEGVKKYRIYLTAELKESDVAGAKVLMALKTELIPQGSLPDIRRPGTDYDPIPAPTKDTIGTGYFPTVIDGTDVTAELVVKSYEYKVEWKRGLIEKGAWE